MRPFLLVAHALSLKRIIVSPEEPIVPETADVCFMVTTVGRLRSKWLFAPSAPPPDAQPSRRPFDPFRAPQGLLPASGHTYRCVNGVYQVFGPADAAQEHPLYAPGSVDAYYNDLRSVMRVVENGPAKTFCFRRLMLLEARFNMHMLLNENIELAACKRVASRDFYNVRKVDTVSVQCMLFCFFNSASDWAISICITRPL